MVVTTAECQEKSKILTLQKILAVTLCTITASRLAELPSKLFVIAMFSWKKTPKEPQSGGSKSGKSNSIDNMDFSDLLNDPVHFDGEDGADEMDPDLLVSYLLFPQRSLP